MRRFSKGTSGALETEASGYFSRVEGREAPTPALAVDTIVLGQGPDRSSLLRQRKVLGMRKAVLLLASVTTAVLMAIGGRWQPLPWTTIPASTTAAGSSRTSPRPKSPATIASTMWSSSPTAPTTSPWPRYEADGSPDTSFDTDGKVPLNSGDIPYGACLCLHSRTLRINWP